MNTGNKLSELLGLRWPAVALAFRSEPPAGIERVPAPSPAGCAYWRLAAEGRTFYTAPPDHHGCTIGSFTHNVDLPPDKAWELQDIVKTMVGLEYLEMGRPACAMIPQAINTGRSATSLACIGNRVYTDLADDELYFAIPGAKLPEVVATLVTSLHANQELEKFHRARQASA